jgi:hypothetical protein
MHAFPDGGTLNPVEHGLAAAVWLDDDEDLRNVEEIPGPVFAPRGRTRNAKRWNAVEPQRLGVTLPFDNHDVAGGLRLLQPPQPVRDGPGVLAPPEAVVALVRSLECEPKSSRNFVGISVEVWDPDYAPIEVKHRAQSELAEEFFR